MVDKISYKEFVAGINNGVIELIRFSVDGYSHYNNCIIRRIVDILANGNEVIIIRVDLVTDSTESVSFYQKFKEEFKMFNFGRKGKYTLKEVWEKIIIIELIYSKSNI
jgi:hypothetical protein